MQTQILLLAQLDFGSKQSIGTCLSCNRDNVFFGLAQPSPTGSAQGFGNMLCTRGVVVSFQELASFAAEDTKSKRKVRTMFTGGMPPGGRMPGFWVSAPSIIPAFRDSVLC